jgi:lipoprotein
MLKKNLLLTLLAVFSFLTITTSCEKTIWEWEPMHLVSDTNLKGQNTISVPAEGGTIHVSCTNYESFWFSENSVTVDGQPFKDPNSKAIGSILSTPWLKAIVNKNVMTVVVEPNTTSKVRTTRFEITAGDIFSWLTFEQEAKK